MPAVCFSEENFAFPPLHAADDEGLLLIGGKVTPQRVLEAYPKGIFPWYNEDEMPLWWSPNPRFVLFPQELHISRSMQKLLRKDHFRFQFNTGFEKVIAACATTYREGQQGTWITSDMIAVYIDLYYKGFALSAEAWLGEELAGGMYGILIGGVFFGESMFSHYTNASKFAFIHCVQQLAQKGVQLIDCQVYTPHVEHFGARLIPRNDFVTLLDRLCY